MNNQFPDIDKGDIFAWQDNILVTYLPSLNRIRIYKVNGLTISSVNGVNLAAGSKLLNIFVFGEIIAYIQSTSENGYPEVLIRLWRYQSALNKMSPLKLFRNRGTLREAYEADGHLHILT